MVHKMSKAKSTRWNIPVSVTLDETLEMAVQLDGLASKSELIRISVRKELERMGFKISVQREKNLQEAPPPR
jgi:Arc/MetJ-type ribon-helix-helix transcriptional regulator